MRVVLHLPRVLLTTVLVPLLALAAACNSDPRTPGAAPDLPAPAHPAADAGTQPAKPGVGSGGSAGSDPTSDPIGSDAAVDAPGATDSASGNDATSSSLSDASVDRGPAATTEVVVKGFTAANIYFGSAMDNHRHAKAMVEFPTSGPWKKITLRLRLSCPAGRCDIWDRWGYLGIANGEAMDAPVTEIARFATPYGVGADWSMDVTDLMPLLAGKKTLAAFIDTWVGPGHPQGNGWLVDATFTFTPGDLDLVPTEVVSLWDVASVEVGDPAKPPAIPARKVMIRPDAARVALRSLVTGHGQGNLENCAEFCPKKHSYAVAGSDFSHSVWRTDCATTAVRPQGGRFPYASRAGWCPGATVVPWVVDVTAATKPGAEAAVTYAPEPWENSCRPTAATCRGCVGASCAYDDGGHTAPAYVQSALLIVYTRATTAAAAR
jgi:hypothetical protein